MPFFITERKRQRLQQRLGAASDELANLIDPRRADFVRATREAVRAAHFLNGGRGQSKELIANAKQNDLLRAQRAGFHWRWPGHQRTPAGVGLQIPTTRFSMAW